MNTNDTISKVPILVFMEDHNICFCMKDWHHLGRKLPSTQFIVMPLAGYGPQHQYSDLAAKYIITIIQDSK